MTRSPVAIRKSVFDSRGRVRLRASDSQGGRADFSTINTTPSGGSANGYPAGPVEPHDAYRGDGWNRKENTDDTGYFSSHKNRENSEKRRQVEPFAHDPRHIDIVLDTSPDQPKAHKQGPM